MPSSTNCSELFALIENFSAHVRLNEFKASITRREAKLIPFYHRLLSFHQLECAPLPTDLELDEANKTLLAPNNRKSDEQRYTAMFCITRKMVSTKKSKFEQMFKKCLGPLLAMLKQRNGCLVRGVCVCLSKIITAKRDVFKSFTVRTLENVMEAIKLQDTQIHASASQAATTLIRHCVDRESKGYPLMARLAEGCNAKNFVLLRRACFVMADLVPTQMVLGQIGARTKAFWVSMESAVSNGLGDSDGMARDACYRCLCKMEALKGGKEAAKKYVSSLKKTRLEKYQRIKAEEKARVEGLKSGQKYPPPSAPMSPSSPASPKTVKRVKSVKSVKAVASPAVSPKVVANKRPFAINKRPRDDISDEEAPVVRAVVSSSSVAAKSVQPKKEQIVEEKEVPQQVIVVKETVEAVSSASVGVGGDDLGFPKIHAAFALYATEKGVECTNTTHLVLFAKKKALEGVSFVNVNKYFKAKK